MGAQVAESTDSDPVRPRLLAGLCSNSSGPAKLLSSSAPSAPYARPSNLNTSLAASLRPLPIPPAAAAMQHAPH